MNARPRSPRPRYAFAPTSEQRDDACQRHRATKLFDRLPANRIRPALRDNHDLRRRFITSNQLSVAAKHLDRVTKVGMRGVPDQLDSRFVNR
jgi:hypothetical protein